LLDHLAQHANGDVAAMFPNMIKGKPGAEVPPINWFDCSRSLKELGITPTSEKDTA
jgi:hypothetical protein